MLYVYDDVSGTVQICLRVRVVFYDFEDQSGTDKGNGLVLRVHVE